MRDYIVQLERLWRNVVVYPIFRLVLRNRPISLPINLREVDSILILRYDKIGDMVVTLPVIQALKKRNPNLKIGVVASVVNCEIAYTDENIDEVFVLPTNPFKAMNVLRKIRASHYQVVLNFIFNRMTSGGLICNFACRDAVTIAQGQEKYRFYFNALLSLPRGRTHMLEILCEFIEQTFGLEVSESEKKMYVHIDAFSKTVIDEFLHHQSLRRSTSGSSSSELFVVFNVSARQANKRLTAHQATTIANVLTNSFDGKTVVISSPEDLMMAMETIREAGNPRCVYFPPTGIASLMQIASLVEGAVSVITPDTAIIHIASAVSKPVLGIFTPLQVNKEWMPYGVQFELIKSAENEPVSSLGDDVLAGGVRQFVARTAGNRSKLIMA